MLAKKEIEKRIEMISGRYSAYEIFYDWVTCAAISISNGCQMIHNRIYKEREDLYMGIVQKHSKEEIKQFTDMTGLLALALEEEMSDILGEIFMEMKMGSKITGQFFTPFHISELNARLSTDIEALKFSNDLVTMNEPSCGGGGAIIALAKVMMEEGINYQKRMKVVAQDLDWKGVYMCYLQCSLLGINAIVVQGDTLIEPYHDGYAPERIMKTPAAVGMLL